MLKTINDFLKTEWQLEQCNADQSDFGQEQLEHTFDSSHKWWGYLECPYCQEDCECREDYEI